METVSVQVILLLTLSALSYSISFYTWHYRFKYGLGLFLSATVIGLLLQFIGYLLYTGSDGATISISAALIYIGISCIALKFFEIMPAAKSHIFENMGDGVVVLDTTNRILGMNSQLEKILDVKKDKVLGVTVDAVMPEWLLQAIRGKEIVEHFTQLQHDEVYYEVKSMPFQYKGKTSGRAIVLCDVTSRMLAERHLNQLLQSEEKLLQTEALAHMMFNHHQNMMMIVESKTGHILEANAAAKNFYQDPLTGRLIHEINEASYGFSEKIMGQYAEVGEYQFLTRQSLIPGQVKDLSVRLTTKIIGEMTLSFLILEDITKKMQLEKALLEAKEKAENANQAKDNFLAIISHELRTPMNGILGMAKLALGTKLQPDQREYLELVQVSGEKLLTLLNDLLDFAKVKSGKLELEVISFSLQDVMNEFYRILLTKAQKKELECVMHIDSDVPEKLYGDPRRLQQILMNLADNALKFTEKGLVTVTVSVKRYQNNKVDLLFAVEDTGIGIPQEKINMIFQKFTQVDSSTTRKYGGTGLGLSIVAHLIEIMGGMVWVKSTLGRGSSFYFTIGFEVSALTLNKGTLQKIEEPTTLKKGGVIGPLRILVVEDEMINQKVVVTMLTNQGHLVTLASDGYQAIELFHAEKFDLIFMDIQMPGMDGIQATAAIRSLEEAKNDKKRVPIIAMTAYAMKGDRERLMASGMDEYVSKPLDSEVLTVLLSKIFCVESVDARKEEIKERQEEIVDTPYLDQLLNICQGDIETVKAVISCFLENGTQYMRNIEQAIEQKDANQLKLSAHRLKGAASYFGNKSLVEHAAQLESMGKSVQLTEVNHVFAQLKISVGELEQGLQQAWNSLEDEE